MLSQENDNRDGEIWKDIPGYEGIYQVSNQGQVKSLKRYGRKNDKMLRLGSSRDGYLKVILYRDETRKSFTVHSLVMLVFTEERPSGLEINHIDGVKANNHIDNLEYCTSSENRQHAYDTGLQVAIVGENSAVSKLTESQVLEIRARYKAGGIFQRELAREYGVSLATVNQIINRKRWNHI